jgi:hypothetical protein
MKDAPNAAAYYKKSLLVLNSGVFAMECHCKQVSLWIPICIPVLFVLCPHSKTFWFQQFKNINCKYN